jgi:hypothetical protein
VRIFYFVTGVLNARVSRGFPDQTVGKARAVNQEGRYVKMEPHAGKIEFQFNLTVYNT